MDLQTSKNLGGIGAILLVISCLGFIGSSYTGILGLIGIILVLIAMKGLSDHYNEGGIFNNTLYGFIITLIGGVAFIGVLIMTLLATIASWGIVDWTNPQDWMIAFQEGFIDLNALQALLGSIIAAFIVLFIFAIIAAIFYRRSLNILASKSGVNMFSTAGLILLIGAVLTIILIGFILIWIALILLAVAFFSIKPTTAEPPPAPPPP